MKVSIDYTWGDSVYIKNDSDQIEYRINRIILEQKGLLTLEVYCPDGELMELPEIHASKERDIVKALGGNDEIEA